MSMTMQQIKELKPDGNYTFQRMHTYKAGNPEYVKAIYKDPESNKQARYFTLNNSSEGLYLPGRESKPVLYNQDLLAQRPDDIVCYVEGEKDCDTLTGLGFLAITAGSATDFSSYMKHCKAEHFKGRDVVLFPDNDDAGYKSVEKIAEALLPIAKSIKQVNLKKAWDKALPFGMPQGADITDFIGQYKELYNDDGKEVILKMIADSVKVEKKSLLDSLFKWNDILNLDVQTEYLVQNLIPKGGITLLFGRGGIGKTSLSMQIAHKVAEGLPFGELQTIKTPVYFIDFENPLSILKERVEKIGQSHNLYVWHISNEIQPPRLDSNKWNLYKELPLGLLIFDTLRASHLSDENDSQDMAVIISRLKELREKGFTILLLHHTPKSNESIYKGSTALLDLADHCLGLEGLKDDDTVEFDSDNLYRLGVRIKTRYEPHHIFLTFNPDIKGFEIAQDPDIEKMQDIYKLLKDIQPAKQKELKEKIKEDLGYGEYVIRRLLKKGKGVYWTVTEDKDKKGKPKTYLCICVDTIYSQHKYINPFDTQKPFNTNSHAETTQNLDNSIYVGDLREPSTQIHKCQKPDGEEIILIEGEL
ncbi:MAG: hypothetical protein CO148_01210 [Nitrospirae bacterium CG_4_9_14_3_um_filter_41_27]|nr:MAG: hypothetical protein COV68_10005 [Nitrospirae bacterium CG11_big_fil_rev_8_21_14_0_20_41_14]PIV41335.1 MAG: hypothetical protein COS27_09955 [Nitrospirae bacterium CG02_land_8_20_14_3_00_41_53]PIW88373.1 MAG: hypothetical protein COZ94_00170 [Nitrospirae bacterium CG_4_8_14_3_um_filter_41_47]PJA80904.1 MAG: hypothetical protein CO148_01210 [Nitrospirae bacterium CG_4_9_14_3_um_filter_41_27]